MEPILCMSNHWLVYYLNQNTIALPLKQNIPLTIGFLFLIFGGRKGGGGGGGCRAGGVGACMTKLCLLIMGHKLENYKKKTKDKKFYLKANNILFV